MNSQAVDQSPGVIQVRDRSTKVLELSLRKNPRHRDFGGNKDLVYLLIAQSKAHDLPAVRWHVNVQKTALEGRQTSDPYLRAGISFRFFAMGQLSKEPIPYLESSCWGDETNVPSRLLKNRQ